MQTLNLQELNAQEIELVTGGGAIDASFGAGAIDASRQRTPAGTSSSATTLTREHG